MSLKKLFNQSALYAIIVLLKEKIDELNIPYTVDIVDLSRVSKTFRERALRDGVVWKN